MSSTIRKRGPTLLVADVGGTKTNLAMYDGTGGIGSPQQERTYRSDCHPSLYSVLAEYLQETGGSVDAVVAGVAGPVMGDTARLPNLSWTIDAEAVREALKVPRVDLLNDLEANAYAVPHLPPESVQVMNEGKAAVRGNIAVVSPGTGLGEGFLTWEGSRYRAHASEGGHVEFAPGSDLELELLRFLREDHDHVSYERVCSGRGLPNIYEFLERTDGRTETDDVGARISEAADPTPTIVAAATHSGGPSPRCTEAVRMFVSILGAEAGNLALKVLAVGGVFLGGGLPPRLLPYLAEPAFMDAFTRKGRMRELAAAIPIKVILDPKAALRGAAAYGLQILEAKETRS